MADKSAYPSPVTPTKDACSRCKISTDEGSYELSMFNSRDGRSLTAKLCAECCVECYDAAEGLVLGREAIDTGGIPKDACCPYMGTPQCECDEDCGCGAELEGALSAGKHRVGAHRDRSQR